MPFQPNAYPTKPLHGTDVLTFWDTERNSPATASLEAFTGAARPPAIVAASAQTADVRPFGVGATTEITIPTYEGSGVVTHPSLIAIPGGLNGWTYWLAFTPYPGLDSSLENPSIVVSNNKRDWYVPEGLTNPVQPAPSAPGAYNSDSHLVRSGEGIYLFWRTYDPTQPGAEETISYRFASDGVSFGDAVTIMTNAQASHRYLSPCFIPEPDGSWRMYAVDIVPDVREVVTATAPALAGPWTTPAPITGLTSLPGREPWHLDAHRIGGEYVILVDDAPASGANLGLLSRAVSQDGEAFLQDATPFPQPFRCYRCSFVPATVNGQLGYDVIYGTLSSFTFGFVALNPELPNSPGRLVAAGAGVKPYVIGDYGNRPDSATSPGSATSGQAYTVSAGTVGIIDRALYSVSGGNTRAVVDAGAADIEFGYEIETAPEDAGQVWVVARLQGSIDYWRFGYQAGLIRLERILNGDIDWETSAEGGPLADGSVLHVRCKGDTIQGFVNGSLVHETTDSTFNASTSFGFQTTSTVLRVRNLWGSVI